MIVFLLPSFRAISREAPFLMKVSWEEEEEEKDWERRREPFWQSNRGKNVSVSLSPSLQKKILGWLFLEREKEGVSSQKVSVPKFAEKERRKASSYHGCFFFSLFSFLLSEQKDALHLLKMAMC